MNNSQNPKPSVWGITPILAISCAAAVALGTIVVFARQGGIGRFDMRFDRNGGQISIEGRENVPPKLSEKPESLKP